VLAQQTIPAFSDARHAPPMAWDAEMWRALDGVVRADLECHDHAAIAVDAVVVLPRSGA